MAGGKSTRFGSDKALSIVNGTMMIDHAISSMAVQTERVVICGRNWRNEVCLADRPEGRLGPLAGLNSALHYAVDAGFDVVICAPIDIYPLAAALRILADRHCAVLRKQWAVGTWPVELGPMLDRHLEKGFRSVRSWIDVAKPEIVDDDFLQLANLNTST